LDSQKKDIYEKQSFITTKFLPFLFFLNVIGSVGFMFWFGLNYLSLWKNEIPYFFLGIGIGILTVALVYWALRSKISFISKRLLFLSSFLVPSFLKNGSLMSKFRHIIIEKNIKLEVKSSRI